MTSFPEQPGASQTVTGSSPAEGSVPSSATPGGSAGAPSPNAPSPSAPSASAPGSPASPGASTVSTSSAASSSKHRSGHLKFDRFELPCVMSHFDIGIIHKIKEFPRGSRKAPKLVLKTSTGNYLLKRRARGKDDAYKVAFCHELQNYLADRKFPLPHLIGTKDENNSMLQLHGQIYELFEFIKGTGYSNTLEQTSDSGKILALFHKLLGDFQSDYTPPQGSYHGSRFVTGSLDKVPETLGKLGVAESGDEIRNICQVLYGAYASATMRVNDLGLDDWPKQIVHSDWHPGNMLFRGNRVVAVIDYDAARVQQRVLDIANGALQFSILGGGDDPTQWPEYVDEGRYKRFLRGYDDVPGCQLSRAELRAIPYLMIEALIAEAAIPIANTGQFARMAGYQFMTMVDRKIKWLQNHAERLAGVLEEG